MTGRGGGGFRAVLITTVAGMNALQPGTLEQAHTATEGCYCWIVVSSIMFIPLPLLTCTLLTKLTVIY